LRRKKTREQEKRMSETQKKDSSEKQAYDGEPHAIAFGFSPGDGWRVTVEHAGHVATHPLVQEDGPDICTAAWAAIQALGGGE